MTTNRITEHLPDDKPRPKRGVKVGGVPTLALVFDDAAYTLRRVGILGGWALHKDDKATIYHCRRELLAGRLMWACDCKGYKFRKDCRHLKGLAEHGLIVR